MDTQPQIKVISKLSLVWIHSLRPKSSPKSPWYGYTASDQSLLQAPPGMDTQPQISLLQSLPGMDTQPQISLLRTISGMDTQPQIKFVSKLSLVWIHSLRSNSLWYGYTASGQALPQSLSALGTHPQTKLSSELSLLFIHSLRTNSSPNSP